MKNEFPGAVPEIPVTDINSAVAYHEAPVVSRLQRPRRPDSIESQQLGRSGAAW